MQLSAGYGGTYHLRDMFPPLPAVRPATRQALPLGRPAPARPGR